MRHPHVLVYEQDGYLAHLLRRVGKDSNWIVREPRRSQSCLRLLRGGHPSVLVLKLGPDPEGELTLLARVTMLFPDTATVVVGDVENPALAGLAWDLGAAIVLLPPLPRELLFEAVKRLLQARPAGGVTVEARHA
jgi:DNA-binding NarL/FixJ family response regulator